MDEEEDPGWRPCTRDERKNAYNKMYYMMNRDRLLVKSRNNYDQRREGILAKGRIKREHERREEGREKGRHRVLKSRSHV